jgi:hypothetical protein
MKRQTLTRSLNSGTASTVMTSIRALGGIIGITVFTAIYSNDVSSIVKPSITV